MGLIEGVERALDGARVGDKAETLIPPAQGFGEYNPSLSFVDDIENVPPQFH
jgi:FKBP-type peptidyl-prolyl cis-trans isomerase SlyD